MNKNRSHGLLLAFIALFIALTGRIAYFQIFMGQKLAKSASVQRISRSVAEMPRGNILDRNGIPFTNRSKKISVAIKPLILRSRLGDIEKISNILELNEQEIKREIDIMRQPIIIETTSEKSQELLKTGVEGVSVIHSLKRYDSGKSLAKHVLGYLNGVDLYGETGIEKHYEQYLKLKGQNSMSVYTDAKSNVIPGIGYRVARTDKSHEKNSVILTIDYHIQRIVEDVLERNNVTGAVVVEDVCSGDILAMSSKPDFDQNNVAKYLDSQNKELFNRAVASYNMGSIFKIIVASSCYETGKIPTEAYDCTGYIEIGDKTFRCSSYDKGGHGLLSFSEAFALSCNPFFIRTGINLGSRNIISMAQKFGLGSATGIVKQGVDEAFGCIPDIARVYTDGEIANISIGQGNVMATPLQAADIVATVANGGIKNTINIVDCVVDKDGKIIKEVRKKEGARVISKSTANKLKQLMEDVTSYGTGVSASLEQFGGAGGKTGSAETGQFINGEKIVHAWFAGYFPKNDPKYSIVVFVENGKSGSTAAAPIFAQIAQEIAKRGLNMK
ncbi:MAG: penicillin-binding transpeptidase domain-containing protein [Clostridia bacterium]|nr:penicillin-binding transpeptidase domain-containing protein [Clostridia bacterium]